MSRLIPWPPREPRPRFLRLDLALASLVLVGLLVVAAYLMEPKGPTLIGMATVTDGDSLRVDGEVVRLDGIDAPELRQSCTTDHKTVPCGEVAKQELKRLVGGELVICDTVGRDRYRRRLARCAVDGRDLGAVLVTRGLAVGYRGRYAAEEERARRGKTGLWAGTFASPSDWRKENRPRS